MKIPRLRDLLSGLSLTIVSAIVFRGVGTRAQSPQAALAEHAASSKVLVQQYCTGCHNDRLKTAGVSLEGRDFTSIGNDPEFWEKVLRKLGASEMPPSGMPRPAAAEMKEFTAVLEGQLDSAALAHPNP